MDKIDHRVSVKIPTPDTIFDARQDSVKIPVSHHPIFRTQIAIQKGVERRLMFRTWGGLGDQICSEPTLRYALKMFKNCEIYLAAERPELFSHLTFNRVFNLTDVVPNYDKYLVFETITPPDESNMVWCFISHLLVNCVDFPALCALRSQLPVADKDIQMSPARPNKSEHWHDILEARDNGILIHAGRHWQSKTFPASFWDRVTAKILAAGIKPVLIGDEADDNRGTVDVDAEFCLDLRGKLSVEESTWLCINSKVLLTNDSAPLHMAAPGRAWVGYIATCKHPDMITHWRNSNALTNLSGHNIWQWREVNFGKGGIWDVVSFCPNQEQTVEVEFVDQKLLESWLPCPYEFAAWAVDKFHNSEVP